jgi:membrane protease YdiL (CAAX protease family)
MMFQSDQIQPGENIFYSGNQAIRVSKLGAQLDDDDDEGIYLRKRYAKSVRGILRATFIVVVTIGWIIIAASVRDRLLLPSVPTYRDTRAAYLAIGIIATFLYLVVYFFYLFNIFNSGFLKNIKWDIIIIIVDIIFGICFLALGIACVVREIRLQKVNYIPLAINRGTFMAAGVSLILKSK